MRKAVVAVAVVLCLGLGLAPLALAHFGMVIPDSNITTRPGNMNLRFLFWHPFENHGMDLVKPAEMGVMVDGKKTSLLGAAKETKTDGRSTWQAQYMIKRPGDYIFYMVPKPYWEPAEDCFIIHYTKTIVDALAAEEGWDQPVGLKVEIMPLTRPYGIYAGNSFTGQVLYKGKPLAGADVEVELYNDQSKFKAPTDLHITQVVKADSNGVFSYTMPQAGWWGFAALTTDDVKMKKDGKDKDVEVGGVIWVYAHPMK